MQIRRDSVNAESVGSAASSPSTILTTNDRSQPPHDCAINWPAVQNRAQWCISSERRTSARLLILPQLGGRHPCTIDSEPKPAFPRGKRPALCKMVHNGAFLSSCGKRTRADLLGVFTPSRHHQGRQVVNRRWIRHDRQRRHNISYETHRQNNLLSYQRSTNCRRPRSRGRL